MNLTDGIRHALRALRRDPDGVLPFYLAASGTAVVAQAVVVAAAAATYAVLRAQGRIRRFVDAVRGLDLGLGRPEGVDPDALGRLVEAFDVLVTPTTAGIAALAVLAALAVWLIAGGAFAAAQLHAVRAALAGEPALAAGVRGIGRDVWRFVRLTLLSALLYALALLPFWGALAFAVAAAPTGGVTGEAAVGLVAVPVLGLLVSIPFLLAVYVLVLFVPVAVVVDDVGVLAGVRRNLGFVRANPLTTAGFVVLQVALLAATGAVAAALAVVSLAQVGVLLSLFVVAPFVGVLQTAVYLDADDVAAVDPATLPGVGAGLRAGARRAWRELGAFVRGHLGLVAVALGVFLAGTALGWLATSALSFPRFSVTPGAGVGTLGVDAFVQIATNNWRVAVSQAYAGVFAGVPTATNLVFNGFIVGALYGLGFDPAVFLALILPHGVVEVPALAVAGGLGFALGRDAWRYARGRLGADALGARVEQAFYVLLGLIPFFVVAAFVEAFVTPWVGTLVVGG